MALTPKQEKFAQCVVEGMSQADAYRAAYNCKPTAKPESIQQLACRLMDNVKVRSRVEELKQRALKRHDLTVDDLIRELEEARTTALTCETPQSSAAVAATMGKAKLLGLEKQVFDHQSSDGSMTPKPNVIELVAPDVKGQG